MADFDGSHYVAVERANVLLSDGHSTRIAVFVIDEDRVWLGCPGCGHSVPSNIRYIEGYYDAIGKPMMMDMRCPFCLGLYRVGVYKNVFGELILSYLSVNILN